MGWRSLSTLASSEKRFTRFSAARITKFLQRYVKDGDGRNVVSLCLSLEIEPEVSQAIKDWRAQEGNVLSPDIASGVCSWLLHRRQKVQALKVMKLMREENMIELTPRNYKEEITLTCSRLGCAKGEALFNAAPPCMKTEEVQTAFLCALAKESSLAKVEKWMDELQVISPLSWNTILNMYLKRDKHDRLQQTYYRFKELGLPPDIHTYLVMLRCREAVGGFKEADAGAEAALSQVDINEAGTGLLNAAMMTYAYLGKTEMVGKVWEVLNSRPEVLDQDSYINSVKSFGMCLDVNKALEVAEELAAKHSHLYENPYIWIVEIYVKLKMMDEAEKTLKEHFEKPSFLPYNFLVTGYLDRHDVDRALEKLDEGFGAVPAPSIRFFHRTMMKLLPLFAQRRNVQAAEKVMAGYGGQGDITVYNELLKVYVATRILPNRFMERLKEQNIQPNDETEKLLECFNPHMKIYKHKAGWVDGECRRRVRPFSFSKERTERKKFED